MQHADVAFVLLSTARVTVGLDCLEFIQMADLVEDLVLKLLAAHSWPPIQNQQFLDTCLHH